MGMIGIRRETKSDWERRAPLTPDHVRELIAAEGLRFVVEPASNRVFPDEAYRDAGATLSDDLSGCSLILGVKEIPVDAFQPDTTYAFFSHTIKGQTQNMRMLGALLDRGCSLIDYERIVDARGKRLVGFSRFAGLAGMIDTLWTFGQRLTHEGHRSPFADLRRAWEYRDLDEATAAITAAGAAIANGELPDAARPLVIGVAGRGAVSQGAQEILRLLPVVRVSPDDLASLDQHPDRDRAVFTTVFATKDLVRARDGKAPVDARHYKAHPEDYESDFERHLEHLSVLVTGIYWEPRYPRLVTRKWVNERYRRDPAPRLRVIGDVTLDLHGAVEITTTATAPDAPVYVHDVDRDESVMGVTGRGPVVLAVDFLPTELPVDASRAFGDALRPFVGALAGLDARADLGSLALPPELQPALIAQGGVLTPDYARLEASIRAAGS